MELGVGLPTCGSVASPEAIGRVAEQAERIGLATVWTFERLLRPTEPIPLGGAGGPVMMPPEMWATVYDPLETLGYVAARTSRIGLGTYVLDTLFHSPVVLARRLATLDRLSGGRLLVGLGQGWMEQEFTAAGVPLARRGAGFQEHLEAMRAIWGPDPVCFQGRFYQVPESEIGPKPVRAGGPPLLVGASAPSAVERAARMGRAAGGGPSERAGHHAAHGRAGAADRVGRAGGLRPGAAALPRRRPGLLVDPGDRPRPAAPRHRTARPGGAMIDQPVHGPAHDHRVAVSL